MAAQTITLFKSDLDHSSITLHYDDVTLLGTSLTLSCGAQARWPLNWWMELTSGPSSYHGATVSIGTAVSTFTFPSAIQGVAGTEPRTGGAVINWPFKFIGFSHAIQVAPPTAV